MIVNIRVRAYDLAYDYPPPPTLSKSYAVGVPSPPKSRKSYAVNFHPPPPTDQSHTQCVRPPTKIWLFSLKVSILLLKFNMPI